MNGKCTNHAKMNEGNAKDHKVRKADEEENWREQLRALVSEPAENLECGMIGRKLVQNLLNSLGVSLYTLHN